MTPVPKSICENWMGTLSDDERLPNPPHGIDDSRAQG